jgi:hypothetical protein
MCFPLDVSMVHTSTLTDGERLTCGGFSLGKTIHFGSLEFITNCFDSPSLSPKGSDSGAIFMGTTRNRSPSLWAMIKDSVDEFYTPSSREGSPGLPVSRRHITRAPHAPIASTQWL